MPPAKPAASTPIDETAQALLTRAVALHRDGKLAEAETIYRRILQREAHHFDALHLLGVVALQTGRTARGLALIDRALALRPDVALAHSNRGNGLRDLKRYDEAIAAYDRAIALDPANADAHLNRGQTLFNLGRYAEALASHDRALALAPWLAEAHFNRGNALTELKRRDEGIAAYDRAIALNPGYAEAWANRGGALARMARGAEALASCDRAVALAPGFVGAHNHRGAALAELGRYDEAIASYDAALKIAPDDARAQFNKSACLLLLGRFESGWKLHEARRKLAQATGDGAEAKPVWRGQAVAGKTVLLRAEGGFGDTLQFCRYAPLLRPLGAQPILAVQPSLVGLLKQLEPAVRVIAAGGAPPPFDLYCPLMSLPLAFATTLASIPAQDPPIRADPAGRESWANALPPTRGLRVGLAWRGSAAHANDDNRSMAFADLLPLLAADAQFVCLLPALPPADEALLRRDGRIVFPGSELTDFGETAALLDSMDLVIAVDTAVAHLAGAMGKPVWIALPFNPDWRWLLGRDDSPWYPTALLFRQPEPRDWASVIAAMRAALASRAREMR